MDSGTTNLTRMSPPNEIHNDQWFGPFPWESLTISHALLPVLCAIFIAIVIVVIACCLIQRKPKTARHSGEKRSHTIETSHDVSDHGVYDVIDEVNIPTLPLRYNDKLDSNYMIGAHQLRHPKKADNSTTSLESQLNHVPNSDIKTTNMSQNKSREHIWRHPQSAEPSNSHACLPDQPECQVEGQESDDERIYETLDRDWTFINERQKQALFYTEDRRITLSPMNVNCHETLNYDNRHHVKMRNKPKHERQNGGDSCQSCSASDKECQTGKATTTSLQNKETNNILCQLTMFKLSGGAEDEPTLIDKAYYHVQPNRNPITCSHFEEISAMFQSANLRIVQSDVRENHASSKSLDLVLKPAKVVGESVYPSRDKILHSNVLEKTQADYQIPHTADVNLTPRVKKHQHLRAVHSDDISYILNHSSNHQDIENIPVALECSETKHHNITKSPEAVRISTKLGPLPPLPVRKDTSCEKERPSLNSLISESNYLHHKRLLASSISATSLPVTENLVASRPVVLTAPSRGHSQQMDVAFCVSRSQVFSDKRLKSSTFAIDINNRNYVDNMVHGNFRKISPQNGYITDMYNSCGSKKIEYGSENYHDYFVLEAADDVSSLNSDMDDTLE